MNVQFQILMRKPFYRQRIAMKEFIFICFLKVSGDLMEVRIIDMSKK